MMKKMDQIQYAVAFECVLNTNRLYIPISNLHIHGMHHILDIEYGVWRLFQTKNINAWIYPLNFTPNIHIQFQ